MKCRGTSEVETSLNNTTWLYNTVTAGLNTIFRTRSTTNTFDAITITGNTGNVSIPNLTATSVDIPNNALAISKVSGLQTALDSKLNNNMYVLPRTTTQWILLGSFDSIAQDGQSAIFEFSGNMSFDGDPGDEYYATLRFCTSNGVNNTYIGINGSPFLGEATIVRSLRFASNTNVVIQQTSNTSFNFYINNSVDPGNGAFFRVMSRNTFTYSGTSAGATISGNAITPTVLRDEGIDTSTGETIMRMGGVLSNITSQNFTATYFRGASNTLMLQTLANSVYSNVALFNSTGSSIQSPLTIAGNITISTGSQAGSLLFTSVGGSGNISVDTSNQMNLTVNNTNFLNSNGTTTNITTDVYTGNSTATTRRFTLDCIASGGTPYFTMKARNSATAEVSLTNSTWLFATKTSGVGMVFQTTNGTTTLNAITVPSGITGNVTFANNIVVNGTTVTSDRRLKENIQDVNIDDCLQIFNNLKVKTFDWKRTGLSSVGVIAQDVQEILPQNDVFGIVNESEYQPTSDEEPTMIKTVDYTKLNTLLYVVVKEQQKRIDALETRLANIEKLLCDAMNI
jgi:hypothetical protein